MNSDCLKLTTYFGERQRAGNGLLADALLDIYGSHELQVSVLLRGAEGFGLEHHLRTDRLLTLSEDLPVVAVAVDTRPRIERALEDVMPIRHRGLLTLERARMLTGDTRSTALPEAVHDASKLTIYVGRKERVGATSAFLAVCELLHRRGLVGATVLLGVDGTAHGSRERARFFGRNADVPLMIIAIGAGDRIAMILPELGALLRRPLLTMERVLVCKRDGELLGAPDELAPVNEDGGAVAQKLMIYTSEQAKHDDAPVHLALVRALRKSGARGATTLRGVWGFGGGQAPSGDRLTQLQRRVPVVTIVVDAPDRITESFAIVDEITGRHGLVTCETVPRVV